MSMTFHQKFPGLMKMCSMNSSFKRYQIEMCCVDKELLTRVLDEHTGKDGRINAKQLRKVFEL